MARTILLVDDDPDFVEINAAVLKGAGYTVRTASSGAECLKAARESPPDLVILDMIMEGRRAGLDVSRALKSGVATRDVPLVMITSVNEVVPGHLEPDPVSLPVDVFLEKPVDPDLLVETVAGLLSRGRPPASRRKATILLVDDDPDFLAMNQSVLSSRGYAVLTVSGVSAAVERVRAAPPDLVVTDLMMSSLDSGFSLARTLKGDPGTAGIPVIIVTAAGSQRGYDFRPAGAAELATLGAEAFLEKPVSPAALVSKIEELLARRGPEKSR